MQAHHKYDYWKIKTIYLLSADPVREASIFNPHATMLCDYDPPHHSKLYAMRGTQTKEMV